MAIRIGNRYEWIRGDYQGNIDEVADIKDDFIIFKSGRRCNVDIFPEYLLPEGASPVVQHVQNRQQPTNKGVTMVNFTSEDDGLILDEHGQPVQVPVDITTSKKQPIQSNNNIVADTPPVVEKKVNPITLLITQASKDEATLNLNYTIKLPKKSVYALIKDSFENVDVDAEILDSVFSEININELKDYFKKELLEKIKLHYKQ